MDFLTPLIASKIDIETSTTENEEMADFFGGVFFAAKGSIHVFNVSAVDRACVASFFTRAVMFSDASAFRREEIRTTVLFVGPFSSASLLCVL